MGTCARGRDSWDLRLHLRGPPNRGGGRESLHYRAGPGRSALPRLTAQVNRLVIRPTWRKANRQLCRAPHLPVSPDWEGPGRASCEHHETSAWPFSPHLGSYPRGSWVEPWVAAVAGCRLQRTQGSPESVGRMERGDWKGRSLPHRRKAEVGRLQDEPCGARRIVRDKKSRGDAAKGQSL